MITNVSHSTKGMDSVRTLTSRLRAASHGIRYDTIVGIGISGAMVVPAIGRSMRKNWALIRKDGEYNHAGNASFEGVIGKRFIIVDDFVSSGATVAVILAKLAKVAAEYGTPRPAFAGVWEYSRSNDYLLDPTGLTLLPLAAPYNANGPIPQATLCECGCGNMTFATVTE
jgi:hypothetical protein